MHNDKSINLYKRACFKVFYNISKILEKDDIVNYLEGPVKQMGFNRLTGQNNNEKKNVLIFGARINWKTIVLL